MLKIIDLAFSKIFAEKNKEIFGLKERPKISADIKIKEIEKRDIEGQKDKKLLEIFFAFGVDYKPDIAKISMEGKIIAGAEKEEAEEVIKDWKKSKLFKDMRVFNLILHKCNLKALQFEDELKLPAHVPLPIIKPKIIEEKK